MIDRTHDLSLTRQFRALDLPQSTAYYRSTLVSAVDLALMRRFDEIHLECPFMGARQIKRLLVNKGTVIGRKRVSRLMGIEAVYCRPTTTTRNPEHPIYRYLLWGLTIDRPNQV